MLCSSHGGRHANGGIATIDLLPALVAACGDTPVWFDSGTRSGTELSAHLILRYRVRLSPATGSVALARG
ncbi:alpha-hydroxy-acid oxidizing protein [Cupriavidus sp. CuC1]|uniref:alpha-hydroxy-acid oxidizing protein n=1 Tax=Cupriavidus sp. CuC1 TaxID=3373131 RepID=UPI0037D372F5